MAQLRYEQVKTVLPQLTATQLKDLSNRCKALLVKDDKSIDDDWLFEGILEELRLKAIPIPQLSKIKASSVFTAYAEKSKTVRDILEQQAKLTRLQKRQLAKICTQCLIEYIRAFTDVSLANILIHIDKMPLAIERCFPGYLSSHLLIFILREKEQGNAQSARVSDNND